ncbi:putative transposase [Burkholderia diffusa]|uniref:Putative transposase n=1 Tax=Burkholderia diffusa TaxID=488732 RepID=A0A6P2REM4_9BURK|nr:putative transposase [Burkholderia diffusa]
MNGNVSSYDTPAGAVHTINWKKKFGGLGPSELRRLRELEEENAKLKRLVADLSLDKGMDLLAKNVWSAPALQGERYR